MSDVEKAAQGSGATAPAAPTAAVSAPAAPVAEVPAKPMNAIQIIEQEIGNFSKQHNQTVENLQKAKQQVEFTTANLHAIEGAIQAAQHLLVRLKTEAAKAEAEAKKIAGEVEAGVDKVVEFAKKEV